MSERNMDKREKEFFPEPWEKTYRDGSAQHECAPEE